MNLRELTYLFILAALWGASFLFVRIASPALGPFVTIELRVLIAGLVLLAYAFFTRKKINILKRWRQYLILGTINAAVPFTLIAVASLTLTSSLASILNAMTPIFGTMIAWFSLKEEITLKKIFGMIVGFTGVVILMGWSPLQREKIVFLSAGCSILAAVFYGMGSVYVKKHFKGENFLSISIGQQMAAALVVLPTVMIPVSDRYINTEVIVSIIGLSVFCTALAYFFYFYLIEHAGPTKAITVTFLIPFFGVLWGMVFLNEPISFGMIIGLLTIVAGVLIITDAKIKQLF